MILDFLRPIFYVNDLHEIDEEYVESSIKNNSQFSLSYIIMLISSSIVTTLGLLLGNSPIVIGGMIISPMMWPLIKIAHGIAHARPSYIRQGLFILALSIVISLLSSIFITSLSPIKLLNAEILARTNPTLIDIIVALFAGAVAALGILIPKVSQSLAGVAIATSLMPPLCVSGIGIALLREEIASGGLVLFFINIIAIIFVCLLTFTLAGFRREGGGKLQRQSFLLITVILLLTAIPMFFFLQNYAFKNVAIDRVQDTLESNLQEISPNIYLGSVQTSIVQEPTGEVVKVQAEIQIPEEINLDFQQNQKLQQSLEDTLQKPVDLNLILSRTVSVVSAQDREAESTLKTIRESFVEELSNLNPAFNIETLDVNLLDNDNIWTIDAVISGDPNQVLTIQDRDNLQAQITDKTQLEVSLNINFLPFVKLQDKPDLEKEEFNQEVQKTVQKGFEEINSDIELSSIDIHEKDDNQYLLEIEIQSPNTYQININELEKLKFLLDINFEEAKFEIKVDVVYKETFYTPSNN